jgi:serine/threonine-protein kinase
MAASKLRRTLSALVVGCVILAGAGAARANDAAAAEALFREGRQLMKDGRFELACPKLAESQALDPGIGTLFNLALCYEAQGRIASAWAAYSEVSAQAKAVGQADRERVAHDRGLVLEPRLSYATIRVADPAPAGLQVERDGTLIGATQWGTAIPVDPGSHKLVASAPGYKPFSTQFEVRADAQRVDVAIPQLEQEPVPQPPPIGVATPVRPEETPAPPAPKPSRLRIPLSLAGVAVGLVGVGVGTYFGVQSLSEHQQADPSCQGNFCMKPGYDLRQSAIQSGNASTIAFAVGAAGLAGAAVVWFLVPGPARTQMAVGPRGVDIGWMW